MRHYRGLLRDFTGQTRCTHSSSVGLKRQKSPYLFDPCHPTPIWEIMTLAQRQGEVWDFEEKAAREREREAPEAGNMAQGGRRGGRSPGPRVGKVGTELLWPRERRGCGGRVPSSPTLCAKWMLMMLPVRWLRTGHSGSMLSGPGAKGGPLPQGFKVGQMTDLLSPPTLAYGLRGPFSTC